MLFKKKISIDENIWNEIYKKDKRIIRIAQFLSGVLLVAIAFNLLVMPSNIVYGMNGIGVMFKYLFNIDPSLVILIGSVLLLILSYFLLGKKQTMNSILGPLLFLYLLS